MKQACGKRATAIFESESQEAREKLKDCARAKTDYGVRKRKCQRMSTEAWTMAEAKIEPVLRQVQP
jgi:hypothetical protein